MNKLGKPKPPKKVKRGALVKKAHAIMREIVLLRDKQCVCPPPEKGHSKTLQAGHLIPSTKGGTRWDLYGVNVQCSACNGRHVRYEKYYVDWFLRTHGEKEYLRLSADADKPGLKSYELEELIVELEAILEEKKKVPTWLPYFTQGEILSGKWREETK